MKYKVHLICNAHLDPVWQWRWTEGCSEAVATFRNAVEIIREYPELIFNHNEAILYQWVQKYDPRLFREIRDLVGQNRWFISGGWYLQPDLNLPPYENLVRHIRLGRDYFKSEFGVEPKVAYNFDSFGHPAGMPGLLRDFGYELYIHQRPEKEFLNLPDGLYEWKGLNDRSITAYRIEIGLYHTERKNMVQRLTEATQLALDRQRDVALFWGLGNHGGGATRTDLDRIREFTAREQRVSFIHSTTDRFFESITPLIPRLPVFEGSLQRVFTGCYTSLARIKRRAAEASAAAVQAERLVVETDNYPSPAVQAERLVVETDNYPSLPTTTAPNPSSSSRLHDIWSDILFNDFHDILPGSCTEPAEQDALDLYGRAMENIRRLNMQSVTSVNQASEPLAGHIPVTLYHSNPGLSAFPVEFECMSDYRPFWEGEWVLKLFDRQGNEIPCQEEQPEARLPFHRWRRKISFLARDLKPGVHHFILKPEAGRAEIPQQVTAPDHDFPDLSFLVLTDTADSWGTGSWKWDQVEGKFEIGGEETIIESGPVRTIHESVLHFRNSRIIVHRICYPGWPVTVYKIRIHWNEEQKRLKIAIPTGMDNPRLMARIPGGSEEFPPDGQEHVHGTCLSLVARHPSLVTRHPSHLNIAHCGLHGFDFNGSEVRLSVLRSAAYCHEQGYDLKNGRSHKFMDLGIHEVSLATWHNEPDPAAVAEWLLAPPLVWPHLPIG